MKAGNLKIGQILINSGDITEEQLEEVLEKQRNSETKKRIADILIEDKIVTEQQVCRALEKQLFMPYIDLDTVTIPEEIATIIPEEMATKNMVIPIEQDGRFLTVAIADPLNYKGLKDLSIATRMKIMPVIAEPSKITTKLREIYAAQKAIDDAKEFLESKGGKTKAQIEAEEAAKKTPGVADASVNFMTLKMKVDFAEGADPDQVMPLVRANCRKVEKDCDVFLK